MHAPAGELPLPVIRLLSSMGRNGRMGIRMKRAGPGFTLPANIGDLGQDIVVLDLRWCKLIGAVYFVDIHWLLFLREVDARRFHDVLVEITVAVVM